jgi:pyrroloquinoline quinone biosynthesis protein E
MAEPCRSCARREIDWGGCRCQAFALVGEAAATDPVCSLSPDHAVVEEAIAAARDAAPEFVYREFSARSRRSPALTA